MTAARNPTRRREAALVTLATSLPVLERAYRAMADRAVAHVGLSQAMAWPLLMIGRLGDGLRQGVLADQLGIEGPSLVRQIDQLVQGGFVDRREDAVDRRAKTLHLTPAGTQACEHIESALDVMRSELFEGIPDEDLFACLRVFATLRERLGCPPARCHRRGRSRAARRGDRESARAVALQPRGTDLLGQDASPRRCWRCTSPAAWASRGLSGRCMTTYVVADPLAGNVRSKAPVPPARNAARLARPRCCWCRRCPTRPNC